MKNIKQQTFSIRFNPYRTDIVIFDQRKEYFSFTNNKELGCVMDFDCRTSKKKAKTEYVSFVQNIAFLRKFKRVKRRKFNIKWVWK